MYPDEGGVKGAMSFWQRQFCSRRTQAQLWFDVVFGLGLPLACVWFDPVVFRSPSGSKGVIFGAFALFGYGCFALGWIALLFWLGFDRASGVLAGMLAGGAWFACVVGLRLLPLSLIALVVLIGAIGFTPFLTAFVFARNGWRVYARV